VVAAVTVLITWKVPSLPKFRWEERDGAKFES